MRQLRVSWSPFSLSIALIAFVLPVLAAGCSNDATTPARDTASADVPPSTCNADGVEVSSGAPAPSNACQLCAPDSATGWTPAEDGSACAGGVCEAGDCVAKCVIASEAFATGAANPENPCEWCNSALSTGAWTAATDGTSCGDGQFCQSGACAAGCLIGGAVQADGAVNPSNECERCEAAAAVSVWSAAPAGTVCVAGFCSEAGCMSGCFIDGVVVAVGAKPVGSQCETCDPVRSTTAWSDLPDGGGCAGGGCAAGECAPGCVIDGGFHAPQAADPTEACRICEPGLDDGGWSPRANGDPCGTNQLCWTGVCQTGCVIDGAWYAPDAADPNDPCHVCSPAENTAAWTVRADGSPCGSGQICGNGACELGCFIDGAIHADGATRPGNLCERCQPLASTTGWAAVPDGATCGAGQICSAAVCSTGCAIAGVFYYEGTENVSQACLLCSSLTSTTEWTARVDGAICGTGSVCVTGICQVGCFIDGALVNPGTADPLSDCRVCENTESTASYTPKPDGIGCGPGKVCTTGTCTDGCYFNGAFYAPAALNPNNSCQACAPATTVADYTTKAPGSECTSGTCLGTICVAAPTLTSVAPRCTPNAGGNTLTLTGDWFVTGATVTIAGQPATSVTVVNQQTVTAVTPATPTVIGNVAVTVSNAYGTAASKTTLFGLFDPFAFNPPVVTSTGSNTPSAIATGDLDGDGKTDLIYALDGIVHVKRQGTGTAAYGASSTYIGCETVGPITTADVNEDALNDVLIGCGTTIHILTGVANAAPAYLSTVTIGVSIKELVPANFDGDDFVDLALSASGATDIHVFKGHGNATFTAGAVVGFTDPVGYVTTGDVSGDGKDDLAAGNYDKAKLRIAINSGNATFGTPVATDVAGLQTVAMAKIDPDERKDIVVSSVDPDVSASVYLSLGDGSLGPRVNLTSGGLSGATADDFNGDGITDVLVSGGTGFRVFPGNGDGTFSCMFEHLMTPNPYFLRTGDFDGNGRLDTVTNNPNYNSIIHVMNGN